MGSAINTYSYKVVTPVENGDRAAATKLAVNLKPSVTYAAGDLLGELTATPGTYAIYASGNADGSQKPICILPFDCITDASGNITRGSGGIVAGGGQYGITSLTADVYTMGDFLSTDIPNLDATAIAACGRLLGNGKFRLNG